MIAYKLFRQLKNGQITSLFINKTKRLPIGQWMEAETLPTKGFAVRHGWHCTLKPHAPHLTTKGRVWLKVEVEDYTTVERPVFQGSTWILANRIKILDAV